MCQLAITQVIGLVNSDGIIQTVFVRGTSQGCDLGIFPEFDNDTPVAKLTVKIEHAVTGLSNTANVYLPIPTDTLQTWIVPIKFDALCDDEVLISVHCNANEGCRIEDVPMTVLCGTCPSVTFEDPNYGACDTDGNRSVSITANINPAPADPINVLWLYGANKDQGGELFGSQTSVNLEISAEDYAASQSVQFKLSPLCYYTVDLKDFETCGPPCPTEVSLVMLDESGMDVSDEECLPQGNYTAQVQGTYIDNASFAWQLNGVAIEGATQIILPVNGQTDVRVIVSQAGCRDHDLPLAFSLCEPVFVCPSLEDLAVYKDGNDEALDLDGCLPVDTYVIKAEGTNLALANIQWSVDGESPSDVPEAGVVDADLSIFLERDRVISATVTAQGCDTQEASISIDACKGAPDPETTDGSIDWCLIFRVLMILGIGFLVVGLSLLVCPLFTAPFLDVVTTMIIGAAMAVLGFIMAVVFWALWHFACQPGRCGYWKLAWQVAAIVMFVFIYIAFCPGCLWWGLLGLAAMVGFFLLFMQWLRECRPTRCLVFQELLFIMIHIDILEAIQMLIGNCVITGNPLLAGAWGIILATFTAIAYWGVRNFCTINANDGN